MNTKNILKLGIILAIMTMIAMCFIGAGAATPTVDGGIAWEVVNYNLTITIPDPSEITETDPDTGQKYVPGKMKNYDEGTPAPWGKNIRSVTFPDSGLINIGNYAFSGCEFGNRSPTEITLPDSLKTIGNYAFLQNNYLKTIKINESLEKIGESTFSGPYYGGFGGLVEINIPIH